MKARNCKQITLRLTPDEISQLRGCDAISIRMESTTGNVMEQMWVYTDKFVDKLCDE